MASAALRSGNAAEGESLLRGRLLQEPGDVDCLTTLAQLLGGQGRTDDAALLYRRAIAADPRRHDIRFALVRLLQQAGEPHQAIEEFDAFPLEIRKQFEVSACEAALLRWLGRHDEEIALYERLVGEHPRHADLWKSYGDALRIVGNSTGAIRALRRAIRLRPTFGEAWWTIANLKTFRFEPRDLAGLRKALASNISSADRLHLHFALGKAYEDRGDFQQSFVHYDAGNRIRAGDLAREQLSVTSYVDALIDAFDDGLFKRIAKGGETAGDPIFVVGLQRSGSTLVEQILASHPRIEGTTELLAIPQLFDRLLTERGGPSRDLRAAVKSLDGSDCRTLGAEYLERTIPYRHSDGPLFIDKQPANWLYAGFIRLILPNAKIIDARRHPMACGFSNYKQHYANGVYFSYDLGSIGRYYGDYLRLMRHFDRIHPGAVHRVFNERLIDDPEREIRRMLNFIGVPFDRACLEFDKTDRAVRSASSEQVRRPINRDGVDHWRNYEPWLAPLKAELGDALDNWDKP